MAGLSRCWVWALVGAAFVVGGFAGDATAALAPQRPTLTSVRSLQCPSPTLCVGIDDGGPANLVTSRAPRSGAGGWSAQTIDQGRWLRVLTCASTHWCLAVDQRDRVLISTHPARGARSWRIAPGGRAGHLDNVWSLSCPTSRLCVGVAGHYVVSSTRPERGGDSWRQALVNPNAPADAIDCPSPRSCVAVTLDGQVVTSTDPTGRTVWRAVRLQRHLKGSPVAASVSCASTTRCVVTDGTGNTFSTTDLNAARVRWQRARLGPSRLPGRPTLSLLVSCTTTDVCAAARDDGSVWASPTPPRSSGRRRWTRVALNGPVAAPIDGLMSIACVRGQLCVATDADGHALSANAITRPGAWRRQTIGQPL